MSAPKPELIPATLNLLTLDLDAIRRRARHQMEDGAVTGAYRADRNRVIEVLNETLATELVCMLRYKNHHFMASGFDAGTISDEFLTHAADEQAHADLIARRIVELGGNPDFNPETLTIRSHAEYREGETIPTMVRENLVAERIAIETYSEIIRWLGDHDITTRRLLEEILAQEEEHADDLSSFLDGVAARSMHS